MRQRIALITAVVFLGCGTPVGSNNEGTPDAGSPSSFPPLGSYPQGMVIETDFKPNPQGFAFQNFSAPPTGRPSYTLAEARVMFGDAAICEGVSGGQCNAKPIAAQWVEMINKKVAIGHCEGFAVLSARMWKGLDKASDFGGQTAYQLQPTDELVRKLGLYWAYQLTMPTAAKRSETVGQKTPSEVLQGIIAALGSGAPDPITLAYFQEGKGGHAVTPYAVKKESDTLFKVLIYDNNYPGEEKAVDFDTAANTWKYALGSLNPGQPAEAWGGDAQTKSIGYTPLSSRTQAVCPFCDEAGAAQLRQVILAGHAHALVKEGASRIGYDGTTFVNEMAGATMSVPAGGRAQFTEPVYFIPVGKAVEVVLDGANVSAPDSEELAVFGGHTAVDISNLHIGTRKETLTLSADGDSVSFSPGAEERPKIALSISRDGADYRVEVSGIDVTGDAHIDLKLDEATGRIAISDSDGAPDTFGVKITRTSDSSVDEFTHEGIALGADAIDWLDFAAWNGTGPMNEEIDSNGDGTVEQTVALDDSIP